MSVLKKVFSVLTLLFLTIVVLILLTIGLVVNYPEKTWNLLQPYVLPSNIQLSWDGVDLKIKDYSLNDVSFEFTISNLIIKTEKPAVNIVIDFAHLDASMKFSRNEKLLHVYRFLVNVNKESRYAVDSEETSASDKKTVQIIERVTEDLKWASQFVTVDAFAFRVKLLTIERKNEVDLMVSADINFDSSLNKAPFDYSIDFAIEDKVRVHSQGTAEFHFYEPKAFVQLNGEFDLKGYNSSSDGTIAIVAEEIGVEVFIDGNFSYTKDNLNVATKSHVKLRVDQNHAVLSLDGSLDGVKNSFIRINSYSASFDTPLHNGMISSDPQTKLNLNVPVTFSVPDFKTKEEIERACDCDISQPILINLSGYIWFIRIISDDHQPQPIFDLSLNASKNVKDKLLIRTAIDLSGVKSSDKIELKPKVDMEVNVKNFQWFKMLLDSMNVFIPSNLVNLDGNICMKLNGPIDISRNEYIVPASVIVNLASQSQTIDLDSYVELKVSSNFSKIEVNTNILVNKLKLQMPPFKPTQGIPRVPKDSRIQIRPINKTSTKSFKVDVNLTVKTVANGAIHLMSEYFEPYLPLTLNLSFSEEDMNSILFQIEPFDIVYFRRVVRVDSMKIFEPKNTDEFLLIDGRLIVAKTEYMIFIDVNGPSDQPDISLSSEPYLPRTEILSVLLFDRTTEQLIGADQETTGQVEAAIADRAIGLFGIWAFASTPIRGFRYNPVTGVYSASLVLADDVTASIGTSWETMTQVELRKRVSRNWVLTASWVPTDLGDEESTRLVLQWERRF